jgi:F-type H+-transporting ATPase subunit b
MLDFSVTSIITIINSVLLVLILRAILFKPVTKFMAERAQRIQASIDLAEKEKSHARNLLQQYQEKLKTADTEAEGIMRAAREQAVAEADRILAESKAEAERITETARTKLETDRLAALSLFKTEAAALVVNAAGCLLRRELAGQEQQQYAKEILEQMINDTGN